MSNLTTVETTYAAVGRGDIAAAVAALFEFVGLRLGVTRFEPLRTFESGDTVIALVAIEGTAPGPGRTWGGTAAQQFTFDAAGKVRFFRDHRDSWPLALDERLGAGSR